MRRLFLKYKLVPDDWGFKRCSEDFSDKDAELLVKHFGIPPEESRLRQIMEKAKKRRSAYVEKLEESRNERSRSDK